MKDKVRPREFVYILYTIWPAIEKVYIFSGPHFNKLTLNEHKDLDIF